MSDTSEFVIDQQKKHKVVTWLAKIERLFSVKVTFTNGGSADGMLWVVLKGQQEKREKAKDYIKALSSPEQRNVVQIPVALVADVGEDSTEHSKLETEYGVIVSFPHETSAVIEGNVIQVTLASSKLEELIKERLVDAHVKVNPALGDFALKLGYAQADVDAVFEKLGPHADKNTFLNELINFSKKPRLVEDRSLPSPIIHNGVVRPTTYSRDPYPRNPNEMAASRCMPSTSSNMNHYNGGGVVAKGYLRPESSGVVSRGFVARTTAQTTPHNVLSSTYSMPPDYGNFPPNSKFYQPPANEYNQMGHDHFQEEQMFRDLLTNSCRYSQFPASNLRHVVIDGSNVAMSHGNNKIFSCMGILLCVEWFKKRGHTQITVFVPQWRKETTKPESPIADQHILNQLEEEGCLTFTPSRRIGGRRIVCYDDRFILRLANETDGVVVSNDNFKDLAQENAKWKEIIEQRLLMYSFVNDMFMPPDDPLGRHGPTLDEFLQKGTPTHRRLCPYGRRCTYGQRCKFYHPERADKRLAIYQALKDMFPSQDALIVNVMKKYPHEKDPSVLASRILDTLDV